jgi:hypothetical protein
MRAVLLALLALPATLAAQDTVIVIRPESSGVSIEARDLPQAVVDAAIRFYNAPGTARLYGRTSLPAGAVWRGDVAVRTGPVTLAGRLEGSLLVVNGDLTLAAGAEVTGSALVVGGGATGVDSARVGEGIRVYASPLFYRIEGDTLVHAPGLARRLRGLAARQSWDIADSRVSLLLATGGTYNRVEGLPIVGGPVFDLRVTRGTRLKIDILGMFRTGGQAAGEGADLGFMVRGELRRGEVTGYGIGARAYDAVTPIEDWTLHANEVGWATFLFHRDYRDYYHNLGYAFRVFAQPARQLVLGAEVQYDRHRSAPTNDPIALLRNDENWRPNPPIDNGHYLTFSGSATYDTRNDRWDPTSGTFIRATVETSGSDDVAPYPGVPPEVRDSLPGAGYRFWRLWFDARQYARLTQSARMNVRLVAGGWMGGDPLSLQRRLSVGGADPFPGYPFRYRACSNGVTDSILIGAHAALCDRVLLFQAEFRGHASLRWVYDPDRDGDGGSGLLAAWVDGLDVVLFANAGTGWLVGEGPGRHAANAIPPLDSWLADLGVGLDWGGLGIYAAKSIASDEPARMALRLTHRF